MKKRFSVTSLKILTKQQILKIPSNLVSHKNMRLLTIIIPRLKITHRNTYFRVIVFSHHCLFASLYHLFPHHCIFASLHHLFCGFKNAQKQPCAFAFTREVLFKILQKLQKKKHVKKTAAYLVSCEFFEII